MSHYSDHGKTYDYRGRYLVHTDAGTANQGEFIYFGDEYTDGSIRIIPDTSTGVNAEFQQKAEGVWNDTGLQIAASTIFLGRDLEVKGAGDWILSTDVQEDHEALIPHIEFTDETGSLPFGHMPQLSPLQVNVPIQPDFSEEIVTNNYVAIQTNPAEILGKRVHWKTGSVAATEPVKVSFLRPAGVIFWTMNFPASHFPANSDVTIELQGLLEGFPGSDIETNITSEADFSLLGLNGVAYTLLDFYLLSEENLVTFESGLDLITTDEFGQASVDESGNIMIECF